MLNNKIGSFIATLRKERGLTQEQLAEKLGVTNRSISRWENGNTLPDFSLLRSLSAVLDVSMSEILNGHRLPENIQAEECVRLALELARREGDTQRKVLNRRFGAGLALLVCASLFRRFSDAPAVFYWLCTGLSAASFLIGFWGNNRKNTIIPSSVLICADTELRMKTASEMLHFSMKYQRGHKKQHRQAFEALESALQPREYVQFSFIADSCTLDGNPGPWHVSVALTDKRLLISGESMRGGMLPVFPVQSHDRSSLQCVRFQGSELVLHFGKTILKLNGSDLDTVLSKLKTCL